MSTWGRKGKGGEYPVPTEGFCCSFPRLHQPDGSRRGVLSLRGAAGDHMTSFSDVRGIAERGHGAVAADYGQTSGGRWGTADTTAKVGSAWSYLKIAHGVRADKVILGSGSGGCVDALNWARANPTQVAALYGVIPLTHLLSFRDQNRDGRQAEIDSRYGGARPPDSADPALNPAECAGFPIGLWYSGDDPLCLPDEIEAFAAAVGLNVHLSRFSEAAGHSVAGLDAEEVWDWVDQVTA